MRHGFTSFGLVLVCVLSAGGAYGNGGRLQPPLPGDLCPTSSFGSYRTAHLHGGVDFSTGGRTGLPVLAMDSCWVWRISVASGGYGRALYTEHRDGTVAVYAHLSRFAASIENTVEEEQNLKSAYEVEIYPGRDAYRFSAGDTIAFSGDTGAGPPHLHVELRTGREEHDKVNPFPVFLHASDAIAPSIAEVRITPLGAWSRVGGDTKPATIAPGALPRRLEISGEFGVSVLSHDTGLCSKPMRPTVFEAWVDDEPIWQTGFQRFPFAKTHFVSLFYDTGPGGTFVRLFDPFDVDLTGFDCVRPRDSVFGTLAEGAHVLRVRVADAWDNSDTLEIPFFFGRLPAFKSASLVRSERGMRADVVPEREDCAVKVLSRRNGGQWQSAAVLQTGHTYRAEVGLPASGVEVLARLTSPAGCSAEALLYASNAERPGVSARVETVINPTFIEIYGHTQAPPSELPVAQIHEGSRFEVWSLQPVRANVFRAVYYPKGTGVEVRVNVLFEFGDLLVERQVDVPLSVLRRDTAVGLSASAFSVEVRSRGENKPRVVALREVPSSDYKTFDGCLGGLALEPRDMVFERPVDISVASTSEPLGPDWGLFVARSTGLGFLGRFGADGVCRARIAVFEPLVVLRDVTPPAITNVGRLARRRDGKAVFSASVSDSGSGVDSHAITAYVDDEPAIAGFDVDTGRVSVRTTKRLPSGVHRIRLEAKDRMGNVGATQATRELAG